MKYRVLRKRLIDLMGSSKNPMEKYNKARILFAKQFKKIPDAPIGQKPLSARSKVRWATPVLRRIMFDGEAQILSDQIGTGDIGTTKNFVNFLEKVSNG